MPSLATSESAKGILLISPTALFMACLLGGPLLLLVLFSFWTQEGLEITAAWTLANYQDVLSRESYLILFGRSLLISGIVTLVTVGLAYPMAYFVAFHVTGNKVVWIILMTLPFWTSYLLRVFAWRIILGFNGVINSGLMQLGLISEPLDFLLYNQTAVVLTLAHAWAAFAILPIYVSLEKIDRTLLEAATDLGDGPFERFLRVTLPLSMPGVIAASLLIFIPTVGDYVTPALVGGPTGNMIANAIQNLFLRANNWPLGSALAIAAALGVSAVSVLFVVLMRAATQRLGRI